MSSFVHLHLHSQYSLLDGANRIDDVIEAARQAEMPAVALTDHGNMHGAIEFYKRARRAGVKPLVGIEAYVAQGSRLDRDSARKSSNHLVLLARNEAGFRNLIKLTSRSYLEGFYYKPRIDKELLAQHAEGVTALSACLKGEVIESILDRDGGRAERLACEMRDLFGDGNYFLEMQHHGIEAQATANVELRRLSKRTGIPLVVTNDCHYLSQSDAVAHDVLLCIGTQRALDDPDRLRYASNEFYMKTADEMFRLFPDDATAIENTLRVAESCDLVLEDSGFHLPDFPVPEGYTVETYFEEVARRGLERRFDELRKAGWPRPGDPSAEEYRRRLETEIGIIERMDFPGYFLIVWDFMRYAAENQIPVGPGRGSAAGSLVAFALRITDVDPLRYQLVFERFLNPERVSLPDIDIDFCMRRRGEVIQYVNEKYGRDRVAQIITFGTLAAKAVIRDVGRVLGVPYAKVDRVAKMVPDMTRSLASAAKEVAALKDEVQRDEEVARIVQIGSRLEGLTRHASLHAAGVVIAPRPIEELVPLAKTNKDEIVTQWDKDIVESLGLLKMDFLGLRTLTVLDDSAKMLQQQGVDIDLDALSLNDPEVYRLFCEGRTDGVFQFESSGMKDLLRRAQPSKFEDLVAFNALYRPGALSVGMVDEYIKRKQGKKTVRYILPETRKILEETYGVIAYQEQVMQVAVEVAGFTMGEADVLRKAMGKKKPEVMAEQKQKFLDGAASRGVDKEKAAELWDFIEPFAGYGFNKSHSVAYALLAYKTAYLKAHYPVAFMAAMLTSEMSSKDNVSKYIAGCREMGIPVLRPDINESNWSFTVVEETIRFGLGAVKGVGEAAIEAILAARHRVGRFRSLTHFAEEVDLKAVNRKVVECLVKAGAFDDLGPNRATLAAALEGVLERALRKQRDAEEGQGALFAAAALPEPELPNGVEPWPEPERLRYEKETLGFYLSGHPLAEYRHALAKLATHTTSAVKEGADGSVVLGGLVARLRRTKIKSGPNAGRFMGRFELEDLEGALPVAVFANLMEKCSGLMREESLILLRAQARDRAGEIELTAEEILDLREVAAPRLEAMELTLPESTSSGEILQLRDLLIENSGEVPIEIEVQLEADQRVRIATESRFRVNASAELEAAITALLGEGRLRHRYAET